MQILAAMASGRSASRAAMQRSARCGFGSCALGWQHGHMVGLGFGLDQQRTDTDPLAGSMAGFSLGQQGAQALGSSETGYLQWQG